MCEHKWKIKDTLILPSFFEQAKDLGLSNVDGPLEELSRKDALITYVCAKCGNEKVERV